MLDAFRAPVSAVLDLLPSTRRRRPQPGPHGQGTVAPRGEWTEPHDPNGGDPRAPTDPSPTRVGWSAPVQRALLILALWCAVLAAYRVTERPLTVVDVEAVMRLPISLWHDGDLDLNEYRDIVPAAALSSHGGRVVSKLPFWPAFQLLPAYLLHALGRGFPDENDVWVAQRRAAQLFMATTTVLVGLLLTRRHGRAVGAVVAIAFGFGTINWFVLSQLSFSNGLVQFWLALALLWGCRQATPSRAAATGSLLAMVIASFYRLSLLPVAALWTAYLVWRLRRSAVVPLVAAVGLFCAMALANEIYMGQPLGFYGVVAGRQPFPSPTLGEALYGNLLSPSRGLLVFSPWIGLSLVGLVAARRGERALLWTLFASCVVHLLVTSNHAHWFGGGSMGPRLTADVLPLWAVLAATGLATAMPRPAARWPAIALVVVSVVIAGGHAFARDSRWTEVPVPLNSATRVRLFDWRDAEVLAPFRSSPYEGRYPIRLRRPEHQATSCEPEVTFSWDPPSRSDVALTLELAVNPAVRLAGWSKLRFGAPLRDRFTVGISQLPGGRYPGQPVAWRVVAEDDEGRTVATSPWRLVSWVRPLSQQAETVFSAGFESGDWSGWSLARTPGRRGRAGAASESE